LPAGDGVHGCGAGRGNATAVLGEALHAPAAALGVATQRLDIRTTGCKPLPGLTPGLGIGTGLCEPRPFVGFPRWPTPSRAGAAGCIRGTALVAHPLEARALRGIGVGAAARICMSVRIARAPRVRALSVPASVAGIGRSIGVIPALRTQIIQNAGGELGQGHTCRRDCNDSENRKSSELHGVGVQLLTTRAAAAPAEPR
jgi:hypothetical protein